MRIFIPLLLSLFVFPSHAEDVRQSMPMDQCEEHIPYGQPKSARSNTSLICRQGYALEHDNKAKIPAWVAYTLTPERAVGCYQRMGRFKADPSISYEYNATTKDYAKSNYDIGHMANSGDMRWSPLVEAESSLYSNAAPQLPGLNRGSWKMLEEQTRAWAVQRQHHLLIYVGPVYEKTAPSTIGVGRVTIPISFYKIIVDQETSEVLTFLYPHQESSLPPSAFQTSLAVVQGITQIIFPLPMTPVMSVAIWPADTKSARFAKTKTCILAQK